MNHLKTCSVKNVFLSNPLKNLQLLTFKENGSEPEFRRDRFRKKDKKPVQTGNADRHRCPGCPPIRSDSGVGNCVQAGGSGLPDSGFELVLGPQTSSLKN